MIPPRWGRRAVLEVLEASRRARREWHTRIPGSSRTRTPSVQRAQLRRPVSLMTRQNTAD
jgi:phage gp37-like protein